MFRVQNTKASSISIVVTLPLGFLHVPDRVVINVPFPDRIGHDRAQGDEDFFLGPYAYRGFLFGTQLIFSFSGISLLRPLGLVFTFLLRWMMNCSTES